MASPVPVTAQMVGNAFVTQYYNVLHQMPQIVYRFYTDESRLTRAEAGSAGKTQTAGTQDEIHRVVMSLDHKNCRAEIVTVDALDSFSGSVFVLVTGAMHKNSSTRKFVQSFFLAPQDRGYYVLNDIFRYLDEETQTAAPSEDNSNGLSGMYESAQMASNTVVPEASDFKPPAIGEEALLAEELQFSEHSRDVIDDEHQGVEETAPYQTTEALSLENVRPVEQLSLVDDVQSAPLEEVPAEKKSYASILRVSRDSHTPSQAAVALHHAVLNPEQSVLSHQHINLSQWSSAHVPAEAKPQPLPAENEGMLSSDLKSVYIKNLPANITDGQLEDELRRFGPVRPNSIILRSNKDGGLYAFVDFEDSISAQAAIKASPVLIGGRKGHIEERKSTYSGGRGRGRGQGRGMLQNDGSRARGTYSTGVSGRVSSVYGDGDAMTRGRGVRPVRSVF
eukprot:c5230_g1_i1 orf=340-1686(+)